MSVVEGRTLGAWVAAEVVSQSFPSVHLCRDSMFGFDSDRWAYPATRSPAVCGVQGGPAQMFRILGTGFGSLRVVNLLEAAGCRPVGTLYRRICPTCLAAWRRARKRVEALPGDPAHAVPGIADGVSVIVEDPS